MWSCLFIAQPFFIDVATKRGRDELSADRVIGKVLSNKCGNEDGRSARDLLLELKVFSLILFTSSFHDLFPGGVPEDGTAFPSIRPFWGSSSYGER